MKQHTKLLVLLSVQVAGIFITAPSYNYQGFLAQGDHGHDLYAAQAVYRGELPYRDFWWEYGPIMPYYYGLFLKIFGNQISSMLIGKLVLKILGGILMCLAMMEISSPLTAFVCACWFMLFQLDFFYTTNHIGGIVMLLGVICCLLSYIQKNSLKAAWISLGFIFVLSLIKINFGVIALLMCLLTVGACDHARRIPVGPSKKIFYAVILLGLPSLLFFIYYSLLKNLSFTEINQCLPYIHGDQINSPTPLMTIGNYLHSTYLKMTSNTMNFVVALIINVSALRCIYLFAKNKLTQPRKSIVALSLGMLGIFCVLNFHEYIKSGIWYRGYWAQPLSIMISFLLIDIAAQSISKFIHRMIFTFLAILVFYCWIDFMGPLNAMKTENHYFSMPRADVYINNNPAWIATVKETTNYLNKTLKKNELFLALPYDCIYYYLTDKKAPTRQLVFFDYQRITVDQEKSVIAELKKNHVNYVLLSSRIYSNEPGMGFFGKTYCPLLAKYIFNNFKPIARFGDWKNEPGWAWNHGTMILKRK